MVKQPKRNLVTRQHHAVGYCRRSTDKQEQSILDQEAAIKAYTTEHDIRLVKFYIDDAISGTSTVGRQGFQRMIQDAQKPSRPFDLIIVYDVKRFGRIDNDEAGYYRHLLRTHGVDIRYVIEGFTGDRTDDLLRPVKQWQARQESKDLSKVTIRGLVSKATSGEGAWMGGVPPWGYDLRYESSNGQFLMYVRYVQDGSKAIFDEQWDHQRTLAKGETIVAARSDQCRLVLSEVDRQEAVREIFRLYVEENRGYKAIADHLNRTGVPSPRNAAWCGRYSGKWSMTTVRAILINPAYVGDMVWNRRTDARFHRIADGQAVEREGVLANRLEPNDGADWITVQDAHPPIITRRVFELAKLKRQDQQTARLQRHLNTEAKYGTDRSKATGGWTGPKAKYLLSGLMRCTHCGSKYEGHTQYRKQFDENGKRKRTFGYACGGYIRHGRSVCRIGRFAQDTLESAVVEAILDYYASYTGKGARQRIAKTLSSQFGEEMDNLSSLQDELQKRIRQIDRIVRSMLDNITKSNRRLVDQRLTELDKEREQIEAKLDSFRCMTLSDQDSRELIDQTAKFIVDLKISLIEVDLPQRQASIRRCIDQIQLDHENHQAKIGIRKLPTILGGSQVMNVEHLIIQVC